jgi:hypothetical protein
MSGDAMHERSPLADALHHAGMEVRIVAWDAARDWSQFDMLLLRSTWRSGCYRRHAAFWCNPIWRGSTRALPL